MPPEHLASLTPQGSVAQQLDSLAQLHAHIGQGQPAAVSELQLQNDVLQDPGTYLEDLSSGLSPAGDCILVCWRTSLTLPRSTGVAMVGISNGALTWRCPLHQQASGVEAVGFTPCGARCTVVFSPQTSGNPPFLCTCSFDTRAHSWSSPLPVRAMGQGTRGNAFTCEEITFSSASVPMAATLLKRQALLVMSGSWAVDISIPDGCCFAWLPGEQTIVLLGPRGLAPLDARILPASMPAIVWTSLPWTWYEVAPDMDAEIMHYIGAMAVAPEGGYLWAAQAANGNHALLAAFRTSDLTCVWSGPSEADWWPTSMHASRTAVALCCRFRNSVRTLVYPRLGSGALGTPIFVADCLDNAMFSAAGRWLVGSFGGFEDNYHHRNTVRVVDAQTGAVVFTVEPGMAYCRRVFRPYVVSARWSSCDLSQLHIKTRLSVGASPADPLYHDRAVFSCLRF